MADNIKVTVEGGRKVLRKFAALPADVRAKVRPAVVKGADQIAEFSRTLAPVESGALRDSIQTRDGDHDLARDVVAGSEAVFYARWVEFGTPEAPSHPFFFVSYRALKRRVRRNIANAVRRAIRG